MQRRLLRPLMIVATGLALLIAGLIGSISVSADPPPDVFVNNGCVVGNYACLQTAYGTNFPFPYYTGVPYPGFYGAPYVPPAYVIPVATVPLRAAIASGTTAVSPGTVAIGQLVSVGAGGFTAGESVTATVTAPNGQVTQAGSAPAATDGTVTVTLAFPSVGSWQVAVHGQTSNKTVTYQFTVQ